MPAQARTPEELDVLLEDAFLVRDGEAIGALFEPAAVVAHRGRSARGADVAPFIAGLWRSGVAYTAEPPVVLQSRETALVVAERAISVVRRDGAAGWRYTITAIDMEAARP